MRIRCFFIGTNLNRYFVILFLFLCCAVGINAQNAEKADSSNVPYLLFIGRVQDSASNKLCDYLWDQLVRREFESVIDTCSKVAFSFADNACIAGHLAHAYLLSNQFDKAREIYLALPEFRDEILEDFDEFAKYGIYHHDFDKMRILLQTKTEEENSNENKPETR